jgi:hypothetical protein
VKERDTGRTARTLLYGLLISVGALASILGAGVQRDLSHSNDFVVLFPLEVVGVLLGGGAVAAYRRARRDHTGGTLCIGLYLLVLAGAIGTAFPLWLPQDNTILGSALLAGMLAAGGAGLTLASAGAIAGWPPARLVAVGLAGVGWPAYWSRRAAWCPLWYSCAYLSCAWHSPA